MDRRTTALTIAYTFSLACGGSAQDPNAASESAATAYTTGFAESCSDVCNEVVACCVCKCFEQNPWPFNYACAGGCFVLDTILGEDGGPTLVFAGADGSARSEAIVAEARNGYSAHLEAGFFSVERSTFELPRSLPAVEFEYLDLKTFFSVADPDTLIWQRAGRGSPTARSTFATELDASRLVKGPYFVRAVLHFADGSSAISRMVLEVR